MGGACRNGAESYFSRLRRGEVGHHHHISGPYLVRYAQEAAWREDLPAYSVCSFYDHDKARLSPKGVERRLV
jgi:hypothetical protein